MYEPVDGLTESTERPSDVGFYGIILDKILDETCEFFLREIVKFANGIAKCF